MKTFRLLAATALALTTVPLAAQSTATLSPQRLAQHVQTLGSDAFEGRAPATRAETKTVAYLSDQFAKAGLQPGQRQAPMDPGRASAEIGVGRAAAGEHDHRRQGHPADPGR